MSRLNVLAFAHCQSCPLQGRTVVPGHGKREAPEIAFVAEAPGETEVEQGIPLVGKSGSFLRKVISDLGIDEDKCWFTNVCLCRPDNNSPPNTEMVKACFNRLTAELATVRPKLVVTLGATATKHLARHRLSITRSHGMYQEIELRPKGLEPFEVGIVPTYHPSYILRTGGLYKETEAFRDFVEELEYAKSILNGQPPIIQPPYENYVFVRDQSGFEAFCSALSKQVMCAVDLETDKLDWFTAQILCCGFSWKRGESTVVDWSLLEQNLENTKLLNDALKDVRLVLHNGIFDMPFLHHNGLTNAFYYLDTMQAHFLLDERKGVHGLERLAIKYYRAPAYKTAFAEGIGVKRFVSDEKFSDLILQAPKEELFDYNGADADYTYRLAVDLTKQLKEEDQIPLLRDIEMPACRVFAEFTETGLLIDRDYLDEMGQKWVLREDELIQQMKDAVGDENFNPNSPKQLAHYMYDVLKLVPFGGSAGDQEFRIDADTISKFIQTVDDPEAREYWTSRRTPTSESAAGTMKGITTRTTSAYMLYWLRQQHDFPNMVLEWRHLRKRRSLYYTGFKRYMYADGRIRPRYDLVSAVTGRKSTKDPPMHNLPRGDEIYNIIIPDPGWCLLHADYSQAELRMMGYYSGDGDLIEMLNTTDPHTATAMAMFKLTEEDIKNMSKAELSDKRIAAKMITFGLPYGRSPKGLAPQLGVTVKEAEEYIKNFFAPYPLLKDWLTRQRNRGVSEQMIISVFGRRRRFPLIADSFHRREVERQAGNMAIQSAINDLTLLAYSNSIKFLREANIPVKPALHIHDSINMSFPKPFWVPAVKVVLRALAQVPFKTDVKFPAEVEIGERWGSMITVHKRGAWVEPEEGAPDWIVRGLRLVKP